MVIPEGIKRVLLTKKGDKSHFFSKFTKSFKDENIESNLELNLQHVSNKKYLKLYKIDTDLVDPYTVTLENSLNYSSYVDEKDLFIDIEASSFTF